VRFFYWDLLLILRVCQNLRINSSAKTIDTVLEPCCLVESVKVLDDCDCEIVESRRADPFHLALIFPLSQDIKPTLALSNDNLDVSMVVLSVSNTVNVIAQVSAIGPSIDVHASCPYVDVICQ
jgi:hypothetical protein